VRPSQKPRLGNPPSAIHLSAPRSDRDRDHCQSTDPRALTDRASGGAENWPTITRQKPTERQSSHRIIQVMLTNLHAATIMIVFAGGPHTPERTTLACELLANRPPPSVIYLTGAEYSGEYCDLAKRVRMIAASLPKPPEVITDTCSTTWASCRHLARHRQALDSQPQTQASDLNAGVASLRFGFFGLGLPSSSSPHITVITSNYHAPRVRWLLSGALSSRCGVGDLSFITSRDIPWRDSFATPRNRHLIFGECLSWLYCLPLGLSYHPLLLAVTVGLIIGVGLWNSRLR